ncbi:MAG TPA: MarR family transcriptional regulator [Stellaceae bacterium]|nr:MarR family transcriptional regulator [Stellaceae bacterium]
MTAPPEQGFGFLLHDIARLLRKRFDQRARVLGLSRAQWQVLAHLHRHEGINQRGLAEILEIESVTLGRLVDRLEADGWIERRADPGDRRARRLFTTAKVAPVLERMWALGAMTREEALAGLMAAERQILFAALEKIRGNLSERGVLRIAEEPEASDEIAEPGRRARHG